MRDISSKEYWECLYNHKRICEALLNEGDSVALVLFRQQAHAMMRLIDEDEKIETLFVFLNSLNRSLYSYILFFLDISLSECCFQCRVHTHSITDTESLLNAGSKIIESYSQNLQKNKDQYHHFHQACLYIKNHLDEELSLSLICEILHVSKSSACRLFNELTGHTFCEYVRQLRLSRARMLLSSTSMSVEEISAACGFRSSAYFSAVFRSELGLSPSAFRQTYTLSSQNIMCKNTE